MVVDGKIIRHFFIHENKGNIFQCDGCDLTPKIKEFKYHCILFQNIPYYAGGTVPWGNDENGSCRPSTFDHKVEVLGFTTASLVGRFFMSELSTCFGTFRYPINFIILYGLYIL